MRGFLAAQVRDPFDPAPMLIHADWLEERGDLTTAEVLRSLVGAGMPSLHALAFEGTFISTTRFPDRFIDDGIAMGWGLGDMFYDLASAIGWTDCGCGAGLGDDFAALPNGEEGLGQGAGDGQSPYEGIGDGGLSGIGQDDDGADDR